jgi:hypothetical protein
MGIERPPKPETKTFVMPDLNTMRERLGWSSGKKVVDSNWLVEKFTGQLIKFIGQSLTAKELASAFEESVYALEGDITPSAREKQLSLTIRGAFLDLPDIIDAVVVDPEIANEVKNNLSPVAKSVHETGNFPWENKAEAKKKSE